MPTEMGLVGKRVLLVALIGLSAAVVWLAWLQLRPSDSESDTEPARLRLDVVEVDSSDIGLLIRELEVVEQPGLTAWDLVLLCQEPKGCYAEIELTFHYRGEAELAESSQCSTRQVIEFAAGSSLPLGFVQRPPEQVRKIERTTIRVINLLDPEVPGNQRRFVD